MCRRTVTGAIESRSAISAVLCPRRSIPSTWDSRAVSASAPPAAAAQLQQELEHHRARHDRLVVGGGLDDSQEPVGVQRSGHVPDRAGANAFEEVVGIVGLGEHDHGRLRGGAADPSHGGEAVAGDVVPDQAQVGLLAHRGADRLLAVVGLGDDVDLAFERHPDAHAGGRSIGDQQPEPLRQGRTTSSSVPPR